AQNVAVQEKQCGQRLVLRARGDVALGCQPGKERFDFRAAQLAWVLLAIRHDEPADPANVGLLGAQAVMFDAHPTPDLIKQARRPVPSARYTTVTPCEMHKPPTRPISLQGRKGRCGNIEAKPLSASRIV